MYMYVYIYVHILYKHVYDTCRDGTRHTNGRDTHMWNRHIHVEETQAHAFARHTKESFVSLTLFHKNWRVSKKPQDLPPTVLEILASYCDTLQYSTTHCTTEWVSRKPYQPKSSECMCLIHMCVSVSLSFKWVSIALYSSLCASESRVRTYACVCVCVCVWA